MQSVVANGVWGDFCYSDIMFFRRNATVSFVKNPQSTRKIHRPEAREPLKSRLCSRWFLGVWKRRVLSDGFPEAPRRHNGQILASSRQHCGDSTYLISCCDTTCHVGLGNRITHLTRECPMGDPMLLGKRPDWNNNREGGSHWKHNWHCTIMTTGLTTSAFSSCMKHSLLP